MVLYSCDPMAVPKKKTSHQKRNHRRATWNRKARLAAQRAMSLGKAVLSGRAKGFHYPMEDTEEGEAEDI